MPNGVYFLRLESAGLAIAARASRIAKHAGRKTVTGSDIEMAKG